MKSLFAPIVWKLPFTKSIRSVPFIGALLNENSVFVPSTTPAGCSPKIIAGCHTASDVDFATKISPGLGAVELPTSTTDVVVSMPDDEAPAILDEPDTYSK